VGKRLIISQPAAATASNQPKSSGSGKKVIHEVREGETLNKIATTYKTSVDAILSWNESEDLSVLHPGDRISIFVGDDN
jgi:LysM repeat protein